MPKVRLLIRGNDGKLELLNFIIPVGELSKIAELLILISWDFTLTVRHYTGGSVSVSLYEPEGRRGESLRVLADAGYIIDQTETKDFTPLFNLLRKRDS